MREVEPWQLKMIKAKAHRFGFHGADNDDAVQDTILAVDSFVFDAKKAGGASVEAIYCMVVNRALSSIASRRSRRIAADCEVSKRARPAEVQPASMLRMDIDSATMRLLPEDRAAFSLLKLGTARETIAKRLEITRHATDAAIMRIRRTFEKAGLK